MWSQCTNLVYIIFLLQEDKDLVHEFVQNDGLACLIKVGNEADQNYQNYILRGKFHRNIIHNKEGKDEGQVVNNRKFHNLVNNGASNPLVMPLYTLVINGSPSRLMNQRLHLHGSFALHRTNVFPLHTPIHLKKHCRLAVFHLCNLSSLIYVIETELLQCKNRIKLMKFDMEE